MTNFRRTFDHILNHMLVVHSFLVLPLVTLQSNQRSSSFAHQPVLSSSPLALLSHPLICTCPVSSLFSSPLGFFSPCIRYSLARTVHSQLVLLSAPSRTFNTLLSHPHRFSFVLFSTTFIVTCTRRSSPSTSTVYFRSFRVLHIVRT